ncbi:MAG: hypothetical protein JSS51_04415 [Planctomycetes bacterium]|nr:hypothetical protein [Planctomycetota bacterium]
MAKRFFSSGQPVTIGGKSFELRPMKLRQVEELDQWVRDEPIRRARETAKRIQACGDILNGETDALVRAEMRKALEASASDEWGPGGTLSRVLLSSYRGILKQVWLAAQESAAKQSLGEDGFLALFDNTSEVGELIEALCAANGINTENPQKAGAAAQTGTASTLPSPSNSGTRRRKSAT